jgi:hypothetical protein
VVRGLFAAFLLAASPLAASTFPYTEDLTRPASAPLARGMWVVDNDDWTLVQTACSEQTNVNASTDVTLLVRASFRVGRATAAPDAMFDVQLRVDGEPVATHSRRAGARVEGCGLSPAGGSFLVGKRWLAVKLLPSQAPHLP